MQDADALQRRRLIAVRRRKLVTTDSFGFRRYRNVYKINLAALGNPAAVPVPVKDEDSA